MLYPYIGKSFIAIINNNDGIKELTHGYQNCNTSQMLMFGGYPKVEESYYSRVVIWVNIMLNHIDTRAILPRYEGSCMVI